MEMGPGRRKGNEKRHSREEKGETKPADGCFLECDADFKATD